MTTSSSAGERSVLGNREAVVPQMVGSEGFSFAEDADGALRFVGNFDGLYRERADPWGQSGDESDERAKYYSLSRRHLLKTLRPHVSNMSDFSGLEVGCGHGHVVHLLSCIPKTDNAGKLILPCWEGMDVSSVAVQRAAELYPQHNFFVGDLTKGGTLHRCEQYNVVVLGQVWWYLLHNLYEALDNCVKMICPGGLLVVSQAFLENQRYGAVVANGFDGALEVFLRLPWHRRLRLLEAHYDDQLPGQYRDGLIVLRKL